MRNKKNILVTGGAGFIGSHIVDLYIEKGYNVIVVDNLSNGTLQNINKKAELYKKDIYKDNLDSIFKKYKFYAINHHAAQIDIRFSQKKPVIDARINIEGTLKLLEKAVEYKIKRFIFASSGGAVYGEQKFFPADESHLTNPMSPYGISKLAIEKYLNFYETYHKLVYTCLRYSNVYGPRQSLKGEAGVVSVFCKKILDGKQPVINGNGKQTRDYVFVKDVALANFLALKNNISGIYNIATSKEFNVNKLFSYINNYYGVKYCFKYGPEIKGEQIRSCLDFSKAKKYLGWVPKTQIEVGLKETCKWFREYFND